MAFNPPHSPPSSRSPIPAAGELGLREKACRFRTRPNPNHGRGRKAAGIGVRQVHRRVTSPRRRERPFSVRTPQHLLLGPRSEPLRRLLGNMEAVGGPGLRRREACRECWRPLRGRAGCETLPADQLASLSLCPHGDLVKGQEAAVSGQAVSEGRRRAPPPVSSRSFASPLAKADSFPEWHLKCPATSGSESEKQHWRSASN